MDVELIHDVPAGGTWNMAFDEALLEWAGQTGRTCLRFYQWSPPTLSLGYFQNVASRQTHAASLPLPLVRRASGGGAIIHDRELTYSLVFPVSNRFAPQAQSLVRTFHESLIAVLRAQDVQAALCEAPRSLPRDKEPFLCFLRRAAEDVLIEDKKVTGSAQRRHRGAVLQHGSILLDRSTAAPELPGVGQCSDCDMTPDALAAKWQAELARRLGWNFCDLRASTELMDRAHWWEAHRFSTETWNGKR